MNTISIWVLDNGKPEMVDTWAAVRGGLAIHKSAPPDTGWSLTHVDSGLALIIGLTRLLDAVECRNELLAVLDWTQSKETIRMFSRRHDAVSILKSFEYLIRARL